MTTNAENPQSHPLVRSLALLTIVLAVMSSLYHIAAVYLLPLPAEMHPNMHLLLAFAILLIGGAAADPELYGRDLIEHGWIPWLYALSLLPAVFFFYGMYELGEGWKESSIWWVYALPLVLWGVMIARERAWLALGLWLLGFVPPAILFATWKHLSPNVQQSTTWWLLLSSGVPVAWLLFGVFYRPAEGLRRAALPLIVTFVAAVLAVWRVLLWAGEPDEIRSVLYLWPLLILLVPVLWARRGIREIFSQFRQYKMPASITFGINAGLLVLGVGASLYVFYVYAELADRIGAPDFTDTRAGFVLIFMVLELTRRTFGPPLPILAVTAVLYGLWGNLFAPPVGHYGYLWAELIAKLSTDFIGGVFGFLVIISATFIIMFLILGAFLNESGAGLFFVNFALGLFGRLNSGPGLAAVGSSALMGTVSGSASGNVMTTGTFTIPLMKRVGLRPHIAAAAEAAASSGGQIMPPVMGAGAFIMSELIEVPYIRLIAYAAIPAFLYFTIVGINIHFAAGRLGLKPLPREEIPDWKAELQHGWFYLVPLGFLVWFLVEGRTPVFAAVMAVFVMVGIWFYRMVMPFLAYLRRGEREVSDEVFTFVPVTFWVFLYVVLVILYLAEWALGVPLGLWEAPTWASVVRAAVAFAAVVLILGAALVRIFPVMAAFWRETQRGWLFIYPLGAFLLWLWLGWDPGVAALCLFLAVLGLWSAARGKGFEPFAFVPWLVVLVGVAAYSIQMGLYAVLPFLPQVADYLRPFGFLYHVGIFFLLTTLIQRLIWAIWPPREERDASPPRVSEVVALACNPFMYRRERAERSAAAPAKASAEAPAEAPDLETAKGAVNWLDGVRRALEEGGRRGAEFGVSLATIEIVVQILSITGVGNKFALLIETLSRDICLLGVTPGGGCVMYLGLDGFFVALLLTAIACAILGMGMPTTAAYVLLGVLGGPVLIKLIGPELAAIHGQTWMHSFLAIHGDRVAAHMFIFYFAILSAITPPVAIASLVGAKIAGASYFQTSVTALRYAIVGFVVPFLFVYEPSLLALDNAPRVIYSTVMTLLGFIAFSAAAQGWLLRRLYAYERFLLYACFAFIVVFIIFNSVLAAAASIACAAVPVVRQVRMLRLATA